jgi:hypothetical protein
MCDYKKNKNAEYRNNKKDKKLQRNKAKFNKDNLLNNDCDLEEGYYEIELNKQVEPKQVEAKQVEDQQVEDQQVEAKQVDSNDNNQEYPEKTNDEEYEEEFNDAYFEPVVYKDNSK